MDTKSNNTGLTGFKRGFLNASPTQPVKKAESEVTAPIDVKHATKCLGSPSTSKNEDTLELPKPLPSLLDEMNLPYQLMTNSLKLLVFRNVYDDLIRTLPLLSEPANTLTTGVMGYLIEEMLKKHQRNYLYTHSVKQLLKDVEAIIGTYGIPMITKGMESLNFDARQDMETFRGPKQNLLECAYSIICQNYKFECVDSKLMLQSLLQLSAYRMTYWEIIELPIGQLVVTIRAILDTFAIGSPMYVETMQFMKMAETKLQNVTLDTDIFRKMIELLQFENEKIDLHNKPFILEKLKKSFDAAPNKLKYALEMLKEYLILARIYMSLIKLDYFRSYRELEKTAAPILSVFRVSGDKCSSLKKEKLKECFVFCQEVDLNITMTQKNNGKKNWTSIYEKDTDKFFNYVTYKEAVDVITNHTKTKMGKTHLVDVPEIGFYTCPPIISPIYTLCKPAYIAIRDLFNFLFHEMYIFQCIYDQHIPLIKTFITEFIDKFVRYNCGMYCISYIELDTFFDYGRSLFAGKRDDGYVTPVVLPEDSRRYDPHSTGNVLKKNVKSGILKYYEETLDEMAQTRFQSVPSYLYNAYTFVAFVREFEPLCHLTHIQDACATVGKCALRFIHGSKFVESDFCDAVQQTEKPTDKETATEVQKSTQEAEKQVQIEKEATKSGQSDKDDINNESTSEPFVDNTIKKKAKKSKKKKKLPQSESGSSSMEASMEGLKLQTEVEKPVKPKGVSISTQTGTPLYVLTDREKQRNLELADSKKEIARLEKLKIELEKQLNTAKLESDKKDKKYAKELSEMTAKLEEQKKNNERNLESATKTIKHQRKLTEEWNVLYEKEVRKNMASSSAAAEPDFGSRTPSQYFVAYIEEGRNLVEAAKGELNEFLATSIVNSDKKRAEVEFKEFEMNAEFNIGKAMDNLSTLQTDNEIDKDLLLKVIELSHPFSQLTYSKMEDAQQRKYREENPECGFCFEDLNDGNEIHGCKGCTYKCHNKCLEKWRKTSATCPQCRRVVGWRK